jgi:ketosteroid isomerase-like protein
MPVIDLDWARELATEWVAAWNSHDLDRILSHYTDDFEMRSPLIVERGFSPTGTLRGKSAIRPYWTAGLAATPPILFELLDVYAGIDTVVIHYRSVGRRLVTELLELDADRRILRGPHDDSRPSPQARQLA